MSSYIITETNYCNVHQFPSSLDLTSFPFERFIGSQLSPFIKGSTEWVPNTKTLKIVSYVSYKMCIKGQ